MLLYIFKLQCVNVFRLMYRCTSRRLNLYHLLLFICQQTMDVDPAYEFDAPQFVDFSCLDEASTSEHEKYFGVCVYVLVKYLM